MSIAAVRLVYFSPTHTTERVLEAIAQGMHAVATQRLDLTLPEQRAFEAPGESVAVLGAPVYGGRIPPEAARRLRQVRGNLTPAVAVVVYGNRAYEDALLELCDLVTECGFVPVAAGAFIGEHSFSTEAVPLAHGRPDGADLRRAAAFGAQVREQLARLAALEQVPTLQVPGNRPYRELGSGRADAPLTREAACTLCGRCAAACPTGAVAVRGAVTTDAEACILCSACVKACPSGARVLEVEWVRKAMARLSRHCAERKEPETYLLGRV
jgi:ferredoxin